MKSLVLCSGLICFLAPSMLAASIVVAEPTGDAAPSFLLELESSLGTVVSEPSLPESKDAKLEVVANVSEAGYTLSVALVPADGSPEIRETRDVTRASALAQARAMVRAAIKAYGARTSTPTGGAKPKAAESVSMTGNAPVDEPYHPRKALGWSLATTLVGTAVGIGMAVPGLKRDNALAWVGLVVAAAALSIGPSTGIYYARRPLRASLTFAVRAALLGGWVAWFARDWFLPAGSYGASVPVSWMVLPPVGIVVLILAINDIVSAPGLARKSNAALAKKNVFAIAPTVLRSPGDASIPGLAIAGEF